MTIMVFLLFVGTYYYFANLKKQDPPEYKIMEPSKFSLPNEDFLTLSGKKVNVKEFEGKVIIFNFWASWCTPCIEEVPSLVTLVKADSKIVIIAVSGDQIREDVLAFLKSFPGFNQPPVYVVLENAKLLMERFKVDKLPESFIFNPKGEMVKKISGTINWHTKESIEYFKSLRGEN